MATDTMARRARKEAKRARPMASSAAGRPVGRFARRGRNYAQTILWAVRDTFAAEPRRLALALALGGLSLAAQALAILVVYGYSQEIRQDGGLAIPFLGIDWHARTDSALLLAVVVAFAASLAFAVMLNFLSQALLLGMIRRRLARATEGLARAVKRLPDPRAPLASRLATEFGFPRLNGGLASSARSAFLIVQTIPALAGAALSAALLLWMEPVLTLILVAATVAWSALLYPVALRVVRLGQSLRRASGAMRREHALVPASPAAWPPAEEYARSYTGWLRTRAEVVVVVGIGIAAIVAIAIYVMGAEMMDGNQGWPAMIAYVGSLQVALNGVFRTIRSAAIVSRRYPQMVRNRRFVEGLRGLDAAASSARGGETITLGTTSAGEQIAATIGDRLAVLASDPGQRIQLIALGARDAGGTPVLSTRANGDSPTLIDNDAPIVFVDARLLREDSDASIALENALAGRLVLVVHPSPAKVGSMGESRLVIVDGVEITGSVPIGSEEARVALERASRRAARLKQHAKDSDLDDDDDE